MAEREPVALADGAPEGGVAEPDPQPARADADRFKRVGWTSALYLAGALVSKFAKFLLVPFYVRFLTKAEVGTVVFLEALIIALARFFPLGLNQSVKRYYADFATDLEADRYTAGMWWVVLVTSLAWAGLAWGTAPMWGSFIDASIPSAFLGLAVAAAALQGNAAVPTVRFVARQQPVGHTVYTTLQLLVVTVAIVVLVGAFDLGVPGVLWGQIIGYGLWTLLSGGLTNAWARWRPRFVRVAESFRFSVAVVPHLLFTWGITFADRLLLVRFVSLEDVAVYGVGYQLGTLITVFSLSVTNAWLARFFRAAEGEAGALEYGRTLTRMTLVLLWLSLATFALAPEIIGVAATSEYAGSVLILQMVAVAHVFHGLNQAFILPLFLRKTTSKVSASTGLGLAVNVGLNLLLIPRVGIVGAAVATIASYVAIAASSYVYARRVYDVRVEARRIVPASAVAVGLAAASVGFLDIGVVPTAVRVLLVAAFPAALWAWPGLLTPADRKAALAVPRKLRRRLG